MKEISVSRVAGVGVLSSGFQRLLLCMGFAILIPGCATNDTLFAEYDQACVVESPVPMIPLVSSAVATYGGGGPGAPSMDQAVYFDYRSAKLDKTATDTLDIVVDLIAERSDLYLFLRAQTDSRGSAAVNEALSNRRMVSVREYLREKGVPDKRLRGVGIGKKETSDDRVPAAMDAARRVDLEFTDIYGKPVRIHLAQNTNSDGASD